MRAETGSYIFDQIRSICVNCGHLQDDRIQKNETTVRFFFNFKKYVMDISVFTTSNDR